jgi:hypothetical protein
MKAIAIVALCIGASVVYGILHDQVTARVCVEYFTVGHVRILDTESPTILGLVWGVIATWWVGLMLGVPLAIAARAGRRPKRDVRSLVEPIAWLLLVMAASALAAGVAGYLLAKSGVLLLAEPFAARVPAERHARFLADGAAHLASYGVGFLGGLIIIARVRRSRGRGDGMRGG